MLRCSIIAKQRPGGLPEMVRLMKTTLVNGGTIRKLWVGEAHKYRDHLLRLDSESRNNRFGGGVADAFIADYVNLTLNMDSVVHGFFIDGQLRGAAELRMLGGDAGAEAAIAIEKNWQRHGVGSALLERTILPARNRGVKHLHMTCLANNRRMQQLARKFDADLTFDFGSVVGEVDAPYPTPMSIWREAMADSHGFATAVLDAQTRFLRRA
jgi:GNAT superfamily N-acetyltransferase